MGTKEFLFNLSGKPICKGAFKILAVHNIGVDLGIAFTGESEFTFMTGKRASHRVRPLLPPKTTSF